MRHTKEPWSIGNDYGLLMAEIVGNDGSRAVGVVWTKKHTHDKEAQKTIITPCEEGLANARRVIACVNACADISTELLESKSNTPRDAFRLLTEQRNELLAALEDIAIGALQEPISFEQYAKNVASRAIAKAKGIEA